jgi:ribosomal protein S18 acetylase RimI-like enzyme
MTGAEVDISDAPKEARANLIPILEESFEGLYLWHAKRTLHAIGIVRVARTLAGREDAGLIMLKMLDDERSGYIFYVAVAKRFRGHGIGGRLVDDAISHFVRVGARYIYASVEEDNTESKALFGSRGFEELKGAEMAARYGRIRSLLMYREMMVVPGELLLCKQLEPPPDGDGLAVGGS